MKKINDALVPQIRVWGFERTNNSFSAYQLVDSRIYEYLIPTHSFLPPHPTSFMGKKCEEWATKQGDLDQWKARQEEVKDYWEKVEEEVIKPILEEYDEPTRTILEKALYLHGDEAEQTVRSHIKQELQGRRVDAPTTDSSASADQPKTTNSDANASEPTLDDSEAAGHSNSEYLDALKQRSVQITEAVRRLRQAYLTAKRTYRIPSSRLDRIRQCLSLYVGTKNFHNFTVDKTFRDPSAKRVMKSFVVNEKPILINGTEWLSLKVHGQSFIMHQIRKMVAMVALIVRCGTDPQRLHQAMGPDKYAIPKAPSLGLLLERPIFDSYNNRAAKDFGKEAVDFDKFKTEMDEFKQTQIYERMYRDEEKENIFGNFFNHVDNFPEPTFLYVTSGGVEATKTQEVGSDPRDGKRKVAGRDIDSESEDEGDVKDDKLGAEG